VAVAVKVYHTSSSAVPTQPAMVCVAPAVVPETGLEQLTVIGIAVAAEQPSLCACVSIDANEKAIHTIIPKMNDIFMIQIFFIFL
jgi:hypothetical protein